MCDCVCIIHQKGHRKKLSFKQMKIPRDSKTFFSFSHTFLCTFHFIYIFLNTLPGKGASFSALHIHLPLGVCNFTLKPIFFFFFQRACHLCFPSFLYIPPATLVLRSENRRTEPHNRKNPIDHCSLSISFSRLLCPSHSLFLLFLYFFLKN